MTEKNETVIALLGQPNSGKSTLFNGLTGLRQHVGNWPGKTVEKKEGSFEHNGMKYLVADLPGTYSLSANSDEEMITRDYIASGKADVVCILADSSQLERSLYMLADFAGIEVPCFLIRNMSDVAKDQGKSIDAKEMEKKLGIPVILFSAPDTKSYEPFYKALEKSLKNKTVLNYDALEKKLLDLPEYAKIRNTVGDLRDGYRSPMWLSVKALECDTPVVAGLKGKIDDGKLTGISDSNTGIVKAGECKFSWIDEIISGSVTNKNKDAGLGKFDRLITHRIWGKPVVVLTVLLGLLASFIPALPFMGIGSVLGSISTPLNDALTGAGCPAFI